MNASSHPSCACSSSGAPTAELPRRLRRAIETVRKRLPQASPFPQLYALFQDRVGGAPGLWEHSHRREHQLLFSIAVHLARQLRPDFEPRTSMLFEVGDTGFSHGVVMGGETLVCLFYDERTRMGLAAISRPFEGGSARFVRFSPKMFGHVQGAVIEPDHPAR
jgi:hypothetical protein